MVPRGRRAGLVGQLAQPVDDAADEVAAGEAVVIDSTASAQARSGSRRAAADR